MKGDGRPLVAWRQLFPEMWVWHVITDRGTASERSVPFPTMAEAHAWANELGKIGAEARRQRDLRMQGPRDGRWFVTKRTARGRMWMRGGQYPDSQRWTVDIGQALRSISYKDAYANAWQLLIDTTQDNHIEIVHVEELT